jgi:hypothetical protein
MPIRLKLAPEPFCTGRDQHEGPFARSPAYEQLFNEIIRYGNGAIEGRAFLISGHRGAGKSTLARRAVEESQRYFARQAIPLRPILVRLHGPDLFPRDDAAADTEVVLRQVTIAVWRALADEFAAAFARNLSPAPPLSFIPERAASWVTDFEFAGQFRMELDAGPSTTALRSYWRHAGLLSRGALFSYSPHPRQAVAELVALSSAAQAYRRVTGKESQSETQAANTAQKGSFGAKIDTKQILTPLLSLGSGVAVGAGATQTLGLFGGAITGSIAAILSAFALEFSWTRERTVKQEITFLTDTTVASLDRMLPTLVERIRATGLAPIFVVDELDKVDRLFERMRKLVKHLKHFMTERAFFCFITDRSYFEQLETLSETGTYPEEYTYFTDRLFVTYESESFHRFLSEAIYVDEENETIRKSLLIDRDILRFVLLRRARLHMFDLSQQLNAQFSENALLLPPQSLQRRVYGFQVCMQLAVEYLLRQGALADRLAQDPNFRQITYDALYYPARSWENGDLLLQLTVERFTEVLSSRTWHSDYLDESAIRFLRPFVVRVAQLIANPQRLRELLADYTASARWPDLPEAAIAAIPNNPLLRPKAGTMDTFEWRYTLHGLPVEDPQIDAILTEDLDLDLALIENIRDLLQQASLPDLQLLSVSYRVLSTSPSWSETEQVHKLLRQSQQDRLSYPDMVSHGEIVSEYAAMLRRSSGLLALAVNAASALCVVARDGNPEGRAKAAFLTLTNQLQLGNANEAITTDLLQQLRPLQAADFALPKIGFENWKKKLALPVPPRNEDAARAALISYLKLWHQRFQDHLAGNAVASTKWTDLEGYIQQPTLSAWFKAPQAMTLQEWSEVFTECIVNPTVAPMSFAPIALRMLGFGARMKAITDVIPDFTGRLTVSAKLLESDFVPAPVPDRQSRAFVIRLAHISPSWPVSSLHAAFVTTAERLEAMLKEAPFAQGHFGVSRIFVEMDATQAAAASAQPLTAANLFAHFPNTQNFIGRSTMTIIPADSAMRVPLPDQGSRSRSTSSSWVPYAKDLDTAMDLAEKAGAPPGDSRV